MQVRTVLVPLPTPMVVISQSPGFRFGISSAAAAIAVRESQAAPAVAAKMMNALMRSSSRSWKDRFSAIRCATAGAAGKGQARRSATRNLGLP
jgi:hypothetical protein